MTCLRANEVDLPGFLAHPRDPAFREFREHYPGCPDCAPEVRAWTELHLELLGREAPHPSPELLLRLEDAPQSLPAERRSELTQHLATCVSCADELASLRAFDFARALAPEPAPRKRSLGSLATWLAGLQRVLWHPAFAYALVLLLLYPALLSRWDVVTRPPTAIESTEEPPEPAADRAPAPPREDLLPQALPPRERAATAEKVETDALAQRKRRVRRAEAESAPAGIPTSEGAAARAPRPLRAQAEAMRPPEPDRAREEVDAEREPIELLAEGPEGAPDLSSPYAAVAREARSVPEGAAFDAESSPLAARVGGLRAELRERLETVDLGEVLRVRVPIAASVAPGEELEIRVVRSDGRRELRERVEVSALQRAVDVDLPAAWLARGVYRVEVRVMSDPPAAARVFEFTFATP